jgi:uncharacterized protein YjfI (DUF2170 family)
MYQNVRYQPVDCENQTKHPFKMNSSRIRVVGGINNVFIPEISFEIMEEQHAPFGVIMNRFGKHHLKLIFDHFQIKIEISKCRLNDKNDCSYVRDLVMFVTKYM